MKGLPTSMLASALAAVSILLAACGQQGDPAAQAPVSGDEVRVIDNAFEPAHLEVATGQSVAWRWDARVDHDVVGDGFDSGLQREGTFTHQFAEPGTYDYVCTLHPGMTGRITVTAG